MGLGLGDESIGGMGGPGVLTELEARLGLLWVAEDFENIDEDDIDFLSLC